MATKQSREKTEIIKPAAPLATRGDASIPDYLRKGDNVGLAGLENVGRGEMTLPRLGLCQSMTPQRKKSEPKYIAGLEEGMYFNTITGHIYGTSVKVVPLYFYKSRLLFNPIEEGGGIRCQAQDACHGQGDPGGDCNVCPLGMFKDGDAPECNMFYNYASLILPERNAVPGMDSLVVASFKSTGLKVARDWNALMRLRNVDAFAGVYEFTSAEQKNQAGQVWSQHVIKNAGWVTKEQYQVARAIYQSVREAQEAGRLNVELERDEEVPAGATTEM